MAHGDLRPTNILLDDKDHCKLIDFDCAASFGSASSGGAPPWSRLNPESEGGDYGNYGASTELFAIGSIVYYITRGYEPYGEPGTDAGPEVVDLLQRKDFPILNQQNVLDRLIHDCWMGVYPSVAVLAQHAKRLPGAESMHEATALGKEYCEKMRQECRALIEDGLLDLDVEVTSKAVSLAGA
ncbi:hypothetical protein F5Y14DRAFT_406677 [Nemania sp. NC0429]|nr:hypothetical protein F5Y14DRAFT_406677 [Nemania sp. NC0429]